MSTAEVLELDGEFIALPDDELFAADEARRSFARFIPYAWPVIEPGAPFVPAWEIDAIADHLQAVTWGQIQDLAVNIRPRSTKSRVTSVLWPVWDWLQDPTREFLTASFDLSLAREHAGLSRRLVESHWFRTRYGSRLAMTPGGLPAALPTTGAAVELERSKRAESWYRNTAGGSRRITSPRSGTTGRGGNRLVFDDPHDAQKVESQEDREHTVRWMRRAFLNRRNDAKRDARVVIGQRTHHMDAFSVLLELGWKDWLIIPTRFDPARRFFTSIGWTDPRTEAGELANPVRHGEAEDRQAKIELGPLDYASQHDQLPTPEGGTTFRREDWRRWRLASASLTSGLLFSELDEYGHRVRVIPDPGTDGQGWIDYFDEVIQSWDFTFKGEQDSDFVVGQVWGRKGADCFLLYEVCDRMDIHGSIAALLNVSALFPYSYEKLVEDKANGPAIMQILSATLLGLVGVDPGARGKPARARAVAPFQRSGNVFLPEDVQAHPYVPMLIERCANFPRADKDDEIDALSQALLHFHAKVTDLLAAMAAAGMAGQA